MKKFFIFIFILFLLCGCQSNEISNTEILNYVLNSIDLPLETADNLDLPSHYTYEDKNITATWSSTDEEVLNSGGEVFRSLEDTTVTLNLKLQLGEDYITNSYDIVILALEEEIIASQILNLLSVPAEINSNIVLPQSVKFNDNNYKVNWESSNTAILNNKGQLKFQSEDTKINLIATISYNKIRYSKLHTAN